MRLRPSPTLQKTLYFDPGIPTQEKIIFSRYVHEHLQSKANDLTRLRHYVCPHCGTPVGNREVAMEKLTEWLSTRANQLAQPTAAKKTTKARVKKSSEPSILCVRCEKRVPLWDDLEECFASDTIREQVRKLQDQSALVLDNESKERALVGEVISTVALAGQISRENPVSDHGIDMEIEFKNDRGQATGKLLFLQLKSGDSYLRVRKRDQAEVFDIDERHVEYWMNQKVPVMLVIRGSDGTVRWREVRDRLKRATKNGTQRVTQIIFEGERFDVMSVRHWREQLLGERVSGE